MRTAANLAAAAAALALGALGCAQNYRTVAPSMVAEQSSPTPAASPDVDARQQGSFEDTSRPRRFADAPARLRKAVEKGSPRVVLMWNIDLPETDGGWETYERGYFAAEAVGRDVRASLAGYYAKEAFRRVRLEDRSPDHREQLDANVTGLLLECGVKLADLKVATLKAQPTLDQDQVYRQIKAMLDTAELAVEVAVLDHADRIAVRVRDLKTAQLLAYTHVDRERVFRDSSPRRILGSQSVLFDRDEASIAAFGVVASTLVDGLARR